MRSRVWVKQLTWSLSWPRKPCWVDNPWTSFHKDCDIATCPNPTAKHDLSEIQGQRENWIPDSQQFVNSLEGDKMMYVITDGGAKPNQGKAGWSALIRACLGRCKTGFEQSDGINGCCFGSSHPRTRNTSIGVHGFKLS
jgi:hypothetical protein